MQMWKSVKVCYSQCRFFPNNIGFAIDLFQAKRDRYYRYHNKYHHYPTLQINASEVVSPTICRTLQGKKLGGHPGVNKQGRLISSTFPRKMSLS